VREKLDKLSTFEELRVPVHRVVMNVAQGDEVVGRVLPFVYMMFRPEGIVKERRAQQKRRAARVSRVSKSRPGPAGFMRWFGVSIRGRKKAKGLAITPDPSPRRPESRSGLIPNHRGQNQKKPRISGAVFFFYSISLGYQVWTKNMPSFLG
jgi:hypothetical protein